MSKKKPERPTFWKRTQDVLEAGLSQRRWSNKWRNRIKMTLKKQFLPYGDFHLFIGLGQISMLKPLRMLSLWCFYGKIPPNSRIDSQILLEINAKQMSGKWNKFNDLKLHYLQLFFWNTIHRLLQQSNLVSFFFFLRNWVKKRKIFFFLGNECKWTTASKKNTF